MKNKYIVNIYKKRGVKNPENLIKNTLINPESSIVNKLTEGGMILFTGMILLSLLNFVTAIAGWVIWEDWSFVFYLLMIGVPSVLINYFSLWKNDQYLIYFKTFEQETKSIKRKWAFLSVCIILGIVFLLISSFMVMTWALN